MSRPACRTDSPVTARRQDAYFSGGRFKRGSPSTTYADHPCPFETRSTGIVQSEHGDPLIHRVAQDPTDKSPPPYTSPQPDGPHHRRVRITGTRQEPSFAPSDVPEARRPRLRAKRRSDVAEACNGSSRTGTSFPVLVDSGTEIYEADAVLTST
jgi:hypothetical protein